MFHTYRDTLMAARWIVVGGNKAPAAGYTHPRIKRADGRAQRVGKSERHGGIMVTANTPLTWLTCEEALAICNANADKGWLPAFVHTADDDYVFMDADYHEHEGGNAREEFAEWLSGILRGIEGLRAGVVSMLSQSGAGMHILFRMPREDIGLSYPKVVLPCKCGKAGCEAGGKVENWIGSRARYRIQAHGFTAADLDRAIPLLTRAELASLPEFAAAYNKPELADELPEDPIFIKSWRGGAYRLLTYCAESGYGIAAMRGPDRGIYISDMESGLWRELTPYAPETLRLWTLSDDAAMRELANREVTPKVLNSFARYLRGQSRLKGLEEVLAQAGAQLRGADMREAYGALELNRSDFNQESDTYIRVSGGVADMTNKGELASERVVRAARITADSPAIEYLDEGGITADARADARRLMDVFVRDAWGLDKLLLVLWHSRKTKGNLFIVGQRNRGKNLLFDGLARLGFASVFPWSSSDAPRLKARPSRFSEVNLALATKRLVVFDELTGSRAYGDTELDEGEVPPDSAKVKALHGAYSVVVERKGIDAVNKRMTAGIAMVSNAPPCIPAHGWVYSETDTHYIDGPDHSEELAAGGLGASGRILTSAAATNRLGEWLLMLMPDAMAYTAPLTQEMWQANEEIAASCQRVYDAWQSSLKAKKGKGNAGG